MFSLFPHTMTAAPSDDPTSITVNTDQSPTLTTPPVTSDTIEVATRTRLPQLSFHYEDMTRPGTTLRPNLIQLGTPTAITSGDPTDQTSGSFHSEDTIPADDTGQVNNSPTTWEEEPMAHQRDGTVQAAIPSEQSQASSRSSEDEDEEDEPSNLQAFLDMMSPNDPLNAVSLLNVLGSHLRAKALTYARDPENNAALKKSDISHEEFMDGVEAALQVIRERVQADSAHKALTASKAGAGATALSDTDLETETGSGSRTGNPKRRKVELIRRSKEDYLRVFKTPADVRSSTVEFEPRWDYWNSLRVTVYPPREAPESVTVYLNRYASGDRAWKRCQPDWGNYWTTYFSKDNHPNYGVPHSVGLGMTAHESRWGTHHQ